MGFFSPLLVLFVGFLLGKKQVNALLKIKEKSYSQVALVVKNPSASAGGAGTAS